MTVLGYTVNYVDVAIVVLLLLFAAVGCKRGLLVNVLNFIRWSVGLFLCFFASSNLTQSVYDTFVRPRALEYVQQKIVTSSNIDVIIENLKAFQKDLPSFISGLFDFSSVKISSDDLAMSVLENALEPALISLTKAGIFIALFLVFFGITGILLAALKRHNKKKDKDGDSKLRKTDKALGFVLGLIKGAVIVLALCAVLNFAVEAFDDAGKTVGFLEYAKTSTLLEYITEINPFNAVTEGII